VVENKSPIIIVGAGRTGTTIFHRMLSEHPHLAWLPARICARFPERLELSRLVMKGVDYPVVGELLRRRIQPVEGYPFWEHHCKGFSAPYRDLVAADVTDKTKKHVPRTMAKILTEKRNRLLLKITGWPRIGFLSEVFEDARFIHLMRDGRAVANSMLNVYFWQGWKGPQNWGWGELSPAQKKEWNEHGQSFVVLAAIQWKILMDAMEKAKNTVSNGRFLEIRYENLCSDPVGQVQKVTQFCELEWTVGFERQLGKYQPKDTNDKFKYDLTPKQQSDLEEVLGSYLRRYGYL
jgi:omega-hydroxy-beta-dihydromenaquinone-9 sulfotransferase